MNSTSKSGARGSGIGLLLTILLLLVALAPASGAQNRVATPSYVAARPLVRGQVIGVEDVKALPGAALGTRSASPEPRAPVVGWITKRTIAAGEPLRAPAVVPPNVIVPGQAVAVVWREPGIEVRLTGVAANAAASGERVVVRVESASRGVSRRLEGVAVAPGLVQIQ